jgi:hypothetical protein
LCVTSVIFLTRSRFSLSLNPASRSHWMKGMLNLLY